MAETVKYNSVTERVLAERNVEDVLAMLIAILEDQHPGFFEEGLNKLYPQADGEPYSAEYTKPQ